MDNNNGSNTNTILIVIVLVILVAFGVWWFTTQKGAPADDGSFKVDVNIPSGGGEGSDTAQ